MKTQGEKGPLPRPSKPRYRRYWPLFEPHHYLKLPHMIAATSYVGVVEGELVCHVAFGTRPGMRVARACRLLVMPEWQGAGFGMRFLNELCAMWLRGENRYSKPLQTLFHTSHPGLCAGLRRDPKWSQISAVLYGGDKARSHDSLRKSASQGKAAAGSGSGYGGHFRAVQGFRAYHTRFVPAGIRAFARAMGGVMLGWPRRVAQEVHLATYETFYCSHQSNNALASRDPAQTALPPLESGNGHTGAAVHEESRSFTVAQGRRQLSQRVQ